MFHKLWDDAKNKGSLLLNANGLLIISNYRGNDVLTEGEIKFAWILAILADS